ncbi:acyl carrier protein [Salinisphaera sp. T5B8]|uniref:acyl carrier protein n=1 Tax=Salinisphaera sp. T5B8 TaxID=1304154 RepID=UPI003342BFBA
MPTDDPTYDHIYRELHTLLAEQLSAQQVIEPDSQLVDDLGLDSMRTMEMVMDLEDRLDIAIPLNMLPEVQTVDDLVKALQQVTA